MAKTNHITNSFVAGEVSPRFFGRADTQQYNSACEKLYNSLVYPQGGAGRRPGTKFVMSVVNQDDQPPGEVRLIPFHASDGTRWQLVITSDVPDSTGTYPDPTNWKAIKVDTEEVESIVPGWSSISVFSIHDDYYDFETKGVAMNELQIAQTGDVMIITHPLVAPIRIVYDGTSAGIKFTVNSYFGIEDALVDIDLWRRMPFLDPVIQSLNNDDSINLALDAFGDATISPGTGSTLVFDDTWLGRYFKFTRTASDTSVYYVYEVTSASSCKVFLIGGSAPASPSTLDYGGSNADNYYEEGAWDEEKGFPRTVCFFENRLVFGGSPTFPDTVWFSESGDIDELDVRKLVQDPTYADPVVNTDAFKTTLRGNILNEIRWLFDGKNITAGTNYREYVIQGPSNTTTIGPTNIQTNAETPHGSAKAQAVRIENTTVFIQRHRRAVRELVYSLDENSFKAPNLSIIANHMATQAAEGRVGEYHHKASGYFSAMAMQEVPLGILWCLDNNGELSGMTRERGQEVNAWHHHKLGGPSYIKTALEGDKPFSPFILSLSTIQSPASVLYEDGPSGEPDELWVAVARGYKEPGATDYEEGPVVYIERFMGEWEDPNIEDGWVTNDTPQRAPVYMDCSVLTDHTQVSTPGVIEDLPHADGEVVDVVANGHHLGQFTVENASIDISQALTDLGIISDWQAIVGFNFTADIVPITPEVPANIGSSQGLPRRIDQITIHFLRTIGAEFGRYSDSEQDSTPYAEMEDIEFRRVNQNANDPIPMFTGEKTLVFPPGYEKRPKIHIRSSVPLPMQVTHVVSRMVVYEG